MPSPPGWYPCDGGQRYWNGTKWTNRTRSGTGKTPVTGHAATGQTRQYRMASGVEAGNGQAAAGHWGQGQDDHAVSATVNVAASGLGSTTPTDMTPHIAAPGWYPRHGCWQWWNGVQWGETAPLTSDTHHQQLAPEGTNYPSPLAIAPPPALTPKPPLYYGLVSALLPGVGSCFVGRIGAGLFILICFVLTPLALLPFTQTWGSYLTQVWGLPQSISSWLWLAPSALVWWWAIQDAYQGAKKWNRHRGL